MIQESYCSFETAKLLKEKGFEQNYYSYPVYWMNGETPILSFESDDDFPYSQNECVAPSQAVAIRWLREWKSLNIEIKIKSIVFDGEPVSWVFEVYDSKNNTNYRLRSIYATYEEACEAAIRYCLEKLI